MFDIIGDCNVHCDTCGKVIPMDKASGGLKIEYSVTRNPITPFAVKHRASFDFCALACVPDFLKKIVRESKV